MTTVDQCNGRWNLAKASSYSKSLYITVHPESAMGDPNYADTHGYELVTYTPEGLLLYRRKSVTNNITSFFYYITGLMTGFFLALVLR